MIALAIIGLLLALLIAILVFPAGIDVTLAPHVREIRVVIAGLRVPVPQRVIAAFQRRMKRRAQKPKPAVKRGQFTSQLLEKLKALGQEPGTSQFKLDLSDIKEAWRWTRWILRHVHVRVHRLEALIATPDPALTGMVYGWTCAALSWLPAEWAVGVNVDFSRSRPEFAVRAELTVVPMYLLWAGLRILIQIRRRKTPSPDASVQQ